MPIFRYEAVSPTGKITTGTFSGELIGEAEQWLMKNGLSPVNIEIDVKEEKKRSSGATNLSLKERLFGVTLDDLILFCRQIATMLAAGVPILVGMRIMSTQISNQMLRDIIIDLADKIEKGSSLSVAFGLYPKVFSPLFQNVIRTGEESGSLDKSFSYLATLHENEKDVKERIKTATRYPKLVIGSMAGATFFLMTFVVPKFMSLFAKSQVALPLPTQILIVISGFFTKHFLMIIIGAVLAAFAWRRAMRQPHLVLLRDRVQLKIPVMGELSVKIYMSRFCRVFEILTTSGVDIIKTLKLAGTALENLVLARALEEITVEVGEGVSLHKALANHTMFPSMVAQMVAVGEESGQIDTMMGKVADYYEMETNYTIKNLSTLIEPILLLFMGVLVGFMALAIFMPMWNMMNVMKGGAGG